MVGRTGDASPVSPAVVTPLEKKRRGSRTVDLDVDGDCIAAYASCRITVIYDRLFQNTRRAVRSPLLCSLSHCA